MAKLRKPTGRRLREDSPDRQIAGEWVELYKRARNEPDGWVCVNPEDPAEEWQWLDGNDPRMLISLLEDFHENGTFQSVALVGSSAKGKLPNQRGFISLIPIRHEARAWQQEQTAPKSERKDQRDKRQLLEDLAKKYDCTTKTIRNWLVDVLDKRPRTVKRIQPRPHEDLTRALTFREIK